MPKSYWTRIQTPNGLKYFRADEVTDELLQKIKDEASNVFWAEYDVTSFNDIKDAYDAGKSIYVVKSESRNSYIYSLKNYFHYESDPAMDQFLFTCMCQSEERLITCFTSNWNTTPPRHFADYSDVSALSGSVAPRYSTIPCPIPKGTYATKNNVLYKANTEITSGSTYATWDDSQWDLVTVADELGKGVAYVDILQTPFADVLALYNQGKHIVGRNGYEFYRMTGYSEAYDAITGFSFQNINGPVIYTWTVASDGPSETNNWLTPPSIYFNASIYSIAAPYDETHTYSVGDVVSKDYDLYRCTTDISVAEQWTPAHWTQTTVAAELASRPISTFSFSDDNYPSGNDIWNAVSAGHIPMLKRTQMYVTRMYIMTQYGSHGNECDVYFYSFRNSNILRLHTPNGTTWTWTSSDMYDSSLNSTGTNAVQNKTLYSIIDDLQTSAGKIAVFECVYNQGYAYPTFNELNTVIQAGKLPVIVEINPVGMRTYYVATILSAYGEVKYHFVSAETGKMLKLEGTTNPVWSRTSADGIANWGDVNEPELVNGVLAIKGGNSVTKLTLTTIQALTVKANAGTPNFVLEIDNAGNSNNVTVTVKDSSDVFTLNPSVADGNTVGSGKYSQLTCVGNCWTLTEFTKLIP